MSDAHYRNLSYHPHEIEHRYGDQVHIVSDPFAITLLARLGAPETIQPEVSFLMRELYRDLLKTVVNCEFPRTLQRIPSRMIQYTPHGFYEGVVVDPHTLVTSVDIARAGMMPSQVCFDTLCELLNPTNVRQDHMLMSRTLGPDEHVTGAGIGGIKLAGPVEGRIVLFPDPMGATGSSLSTAISHYKEHVPGTPKKLIVMHLMVTPEYIRRMTDVHPDVVIYAYRLDRGLSPADVLETLPGERWAEERGLSDTQYIVPGGGGMGEILNNSLD